MKKLTCIICLMLVIEVLLISGCHSTSENDRAKFRELKSDIMSSDAKRYLKALKILFQAGNPISRNALAEIEYQRYLKETANSEYK